MMPQPLTKNKMGQLRIDVQQTKRWSALLESTNSGGWNSAAIVSANASVSYTPDPEANYTFGVPNPTTIRVFSTPNLPSQQDEARQQRYLRAEEALAATAQRECASVSTRELQIRTLQQAAALLSARADDARSRAAHIRSLLAKETIDPKEFVSLKQERWREERRQVMVEDEVKLISDQLAALSTAVIDLPAPPMTRKQANLLYFLTRHSRPKFKSPKSVADERAGRRVTMSAVSPMRLRTSIPINAHMRSISLDLKLNPPPSFRNSTAIPNSTSFPTVSLASHNLPSLDLCPTRNSISSLCCSSLEIVAEDEPEPNDNGTAIIHLSDAVKLRSTTELLADLPPSVLPSYALDLLNTFDDDHQPSLNLEQPPVRPSQEWELLPDVPETPVVFSTPTKRTSMRRPMSLQFLKHSASRASLNVDLAVIPETPTPSSPTKRSSSPFKRSITSVKASSASPSKSLKSRLKFFS